MIHWHSVAMKWKRNTDGHLKTNLATSTTNKKYIFGSELSQGTRLQSYLQLFDHETTFEVFSSYYEDFSLHHSTFV
jgi:hypothetical protein